MRLMVVALVLVLASGCVMRPWNLHAFPKCADGLPPEILIDPACGPSGVCGYSCLPGRWGPAVACFVSVSSVSQFFNLR